MRIFSILLLIGLIALVTECSSEKEKTKVIAHRGGSHLAPENTAPAFDNAMKLGVDMIEIDVEQTSDGVVIVFHDSKVDRTTQGTGPVDSLTYDYIKTLDAGSHFSDKFIGTKISTLQEVMDQINGKTGLLIEIKEGSERYPGIEQKVVDEIQKRNAYNWVVVQSFNKKAIDRVKSDDQKIKTYYLLGRSTFPAYYNKLRQGNVKPDFDGLAVSWKAWSKNSLDSVKNLGLETYAWTVDDTTAMKQLIDWNISGIITDDPDKLIEILKR
jgi:glycerophosphoryl diester phosphodiesterase